VTNPRADRIRQIVEVAGSRLGSVTLLEMGGNGRGAGLVPAAVEFSRRATILSSTACGGRPGAA